MASDFTLNRPRNKVRVARPASPPRVKRRTSTTSTSATRPRVTLASGTQTRSTRTRVAAAGRSGVADKSPRVGAARKNSPARSRTSKKLASVRRGERKDHDPRTLLE